MLQDGFEARWCGIAKHEAIVEAHRVFDVEQ